MLDPDNHVSALANSTRLKRMMFSWFSGKQVTEETRETRLQDRVLKWFGMLTTNISNLFKMPVFRYYSCNVANILMMVKLTNDGPRFGVEKDPRDLLSVCYFISVLIQETFQFVSDETYFSNFWNQLDFLFLLLFATSLFARIFTDAEEVINSPNSPNNPNNPNLE